MKPTRQYIVSVDQIRVIVVRDKKGPLQLKVVENAHDVFSLLARKAKKVDREHFWAIHLTARSNPIAVELISVGTLTASLVAPRETFKAAIVAGAAAIIVAHCHPSGDMSPSSEDCDATKRLVRAGELLGIPLLDHVILDCRGGFSSLKEKRPELFSHSSY